MKKLVLMLAVVFSASLFACGNKNAAETEAAATDSVEAVVAVETEAVVDTLTNDTIAADTTVAVAVAE
ncbi:hypothetical protein [Paramuribaculum intestinale]|uniref:hypothetical protein n=1 Tax=Paramuribaculum intestinale TaxID=2094151 RepID=UPI0025B1E008|nr:hypothetical protein [Paramuribaculum intestinale]